MFPDTNKISQPLDEKFGDTAKQFENKISNLNYVLWLKTWVILLSTFCFTLFSIVASVKLAFYIFQ